MSFGLLSLQTDPLRGVAAGARDAKALVEPSINRDRISVVGKFFRAGSQRWYLKGLTYGPFAPGDSDAPAIFLPERQVLLNDLDLIASINANCIRLYHVPPRCVLDQALDRGLRVMVDVPWEKHRCFFEDWSSQQRAQAAVRKAARDLRDHPGLLAISVANELPPDIVRFYGSHRVGRFIDELIDTAKQESPHCLATFASFPCTEFLSPLNRDFVCFNIYLNDAKSLAAYLDRLQHLSGPVPLVLGEYGLDSMRHGETAQAEVIRQHVGAVFQHGLAGSFVFSFTDEWFTGGHQITDWAFGITRRDRSKKPAAQMLSSAWNRVPRVEQIPLPRVSVVVCSYNGAATLDRCLASLTELDYPDYEVILVDDGSTDETGEIAQRFPQVRYLRQQNKGLSVARNVGAQAATGKIVAYTDSDCIAEREWLIYLVEAMARQKVQAIGGPNLAPPTDSPLAQCVAASPGAPSHVMLCDRYAEHVPGCNMAFDRRTLLDMGGFDPQFKVAGDDVDICWRFLDSGKKIGYAAAAVVWHHRRQTVRAYLKQQRGYGRSEAALFYKHPHRFNELGSSRWSGIIYGDSSSFGGAQSKTHHGRHGFGLFQSIYASNDQGLWTYFTLLEWHLLALFLLLLCPFVPWTAIPAVAMWILTIASAGRSTIRSPLSRRRQAPWWCRPVVFSLHIVQPIVRSLSRHYYRLTRKRLPPNQSTTHGATAKLKRISWSTCDSYWTSDHNLGREHLLESLVTNARPAGWQGLFHEEWQPWDLLFFGTRWHNLTVRTATEELGNPRRFTRVRIELLMTTFAKFLSSAMAIATLIAALDNQVLTSVVGVQFLVLLMIQLSLSRQRCLKSIALLISKSARDAGLVEYTDVESP